MYHLDEEELRFSQENSLYSCNPNSSNEFGVIQGAKDRHYLYRVCAALNLTEVNPGLLPVIGMWPYIGLRDIIQKGGMLDYVYSFIHNRRLFKKWKNIYKPLGLVGFIYIERNFWSATLKNFFIGFRLFYSVRNKKSLDGLKINGIYIGDLIYSSYIRFREVNEVRYKDFFVYYLIFKSLQIQSNVRTLLKKHKIKFYITSYSSYVQHGVVVREMLNSGVQVYSLGNTKNVIKKHGSNDASHKLPYWSYFESSKKLLTKSMYADAQSILAARMSGQIDRSISYMEKSAYQGEEQDIPSGFCAVIFLHDFLDSPFDYRYWIFDDLYQWASHSLRLISMSRLPIAIKPHPNQIAGNTKIIEKLKDEFPDLIWLDPKVSNAQLFKTIDIGISVFGTILVELAYHNKIGIAAGDHPAADFEICYQPKTVAEYDDLLLNVQNLLPIKDLKDKAITFFAAQNYLPNDQEISLPAIGQDFDWESSKSLIQWVNSTRPNFS